MAKTYLECFDDLYNLGIYHEIKPIDIKSFNCNESVFYVMKYRDLVSKEDSSALLTRWLDQVMRVQLDRTYSVNDFLNKFDVSDGSSLVLPGVIYSLPLVRSDVLFNRGVLDFVGEVDLDDVLAESVETNIKKKDNVDNLESHRDLYVVVNLDDEHEMSTMYNCEINADGSFVFKKNASLSKYIREDILNEKDSEGYYFYDLEDDELQLYKVNYASCNDRVLFAKAKISDEFMVVEDEQKNTVQVFQDAFLGKLNMIFSRSDNSNVDRNPQKDLLDLNVVVQLKDMFNLFLDDYLLIEDEDQLKDRKDMDEWMDQYIYSLADNISDGRELTAHQAVCVLVRAREMSIGEYDYFARVLIDKTVSNVLSGIIKDGTWVQVRDLAEDTRIEMEQNKKGL